MPATLTVSAFETLAKVEATKLGLKVVSITTNPDELGFATSDIFVEKNATVYPAMQKLERVLIRRTAQGVRMGYYDRTIGYDQVPVGQAMLQVDCLDLAF
jgi:hypothetical protein